MNATSYKVRKRPAGYVATVYCNGERVKSPARYHETRFAAEQYGSKFAAQLTPVKSWPH